MKNSTDFTVYYKYGLNKCNAIFTMLWWPRISQPLDAALSKFFRRWHPGLTESLLYSLIQSWPQATGHQWYDKQWTWKYGEGNIRGLNEILPSHFPGGLKKAKKALSQKRCWWGVYSQLAPLEYQPDANQHPWSFHAFLKLVISSPFNDTIQIDNPLVKRLNTIKQSQSFNRDSLFFHHLQVPNLP